MSDFTPQPKSRQAFTPQQKHAAPQAQPTTQGAPSRDDIARRAYEIYVGKGRLEGQGLQNWQQAERELRKERQATYVPEESGLKEPPAAHAGYAPAAAKAPANALPANVGGKGPMGSTTFAPPGGRNIKR